MKKTFSNSRFLLIGSFLFLLFAAFDCDDDYQDSIHSRIMAISVSHYDNSGELPVKVENNRCPASAYVLCVRILLEDNSSDASCQLTNPLTDIRIFSEEDDLTPRFGLYPSQLMADAAYLSSMPTQVIPCDYLSGHTLYFMLNDSSVKGSRRFKIEFEFQDGSIVNNESETIELY